MSLWARVARGTHGAGYAEAYAERFRSLERDGHDIHGEARFLHARWPAPARVLDAGCGTGRLASWLADHGYDVVGCDVDPEMIRVARRERPDLDWRPADLGALDLGVTFGVILLAGNVVPLMGADTVVAACAALGRHLTPSGVLVWGFGTDAAHLPRGCPVLPLGEVEAAARAAGLQVIERYSTWEGDQYASEAGYVVEVLTVTDPPQHGTGPDPEA